MIYLIEALQKCFVMSRMYPKRVANAAKLLALLAN
jgi:hypothetical protein